MMRPLYIKPLNIHWLNSLSNEFILMLYAALNQKPPKPMKCSGGLYIAFLTIKTVALMLRVLH